MNFSKVVMMRFNYEIALFVRHSMSSWNCILESDQNVVYVTKLVFVIFVMRAVFRTHNEMTVFTMADQLVKGTREKVHHKLL